MKERESIKSYHLFPDTYVVKVKLEPEDGRYYVQISHFFIGDKLKVIYILKRIDTNGSVDYLKNEYID